MKKQVIAAACIITVGNLVTGCTIEPGIHSTSTERVVIKSDPDKFLRAYELAKRKCDENERPIQYVPDYSKDLTVVAFDCIVTEEELAAAAELEANIEETAAEEKIIEEEITEDSSVEADMAAESLTEDSVSEVEVINNMEDEAGLIEEESPVEIETPPDE